MPPTNNAMCIRVCFFLNGMCSTLPACAPPYLRVLHHSCVCSTLPACAPPLLRVQAAPADQKNNSHYALVTEGVTYSTGEGSNILYDDTNCLCTNQSDCMNTTNALYGVSQGGGGARALPSCTMTPPAAKCPNLDTVEAEPFGLGSNSMSRDDSSTDLPGGV